VELNKDVDAMFPTSLDQLVALLRDAAQRLIGDDERYG
jgi:hypothetical protein